MFSENLLFEGLKNSKYLCEFKVDERNNNRNNSNNPKVITPLTLRGRNVRFAKRPCEICEKASYRIDRMGFH